MRHQNSIFHDVLKRLPWPLFDRLVAEHKADHRVRHLSTKSQLIALLYGQFSDCSSLRAIEDGLHSHGALLYHAGGRAVSRSTLADANAKRPSGVFGALFSAMVGAAGRGLRRQVGDAVYLIDSTGVRLSGQGADWARFSADACGGKVHVIYDANAERPVYAAVTAARTTDITAAKAMPIEPGATYVFDLGYYDYAWWAAMDAAGCHIVTRFKRNTPLKVTAEVPVVSGGPILSDRIGLLPARQAKNRKNPFGDPVREVTVKTETGKVLRILSNDLDMPAQEIADLYKRRWAIELFFRYVKQTLKIGHFLGRSENAVRIQIAVALIAYLLLQMARLAQNVIQSPLAFSRLVTTNLMHRKRIDRLLENQARPRNDDRQMVIQWA